MKMLHRIASTYLLAMIAVAVVLYSQFDVRFDKPLELIIVFSVAAPVTYGLLKLWDLIRQ